MHIKKKLLDIVRDKIRFKHYSISTEKIYVHYLLELFLKHMHNDREACILWSYNFSYHFLAFIINIVIIANYFYIY
jgi:hypothetical protein